MYSLCHGAVMDAVRDIFNSQLIARFLEDKGISKAEAIRTVVGCVKPKSSPISSELCTKMLSKTWDANWNPDGNHCIVYCGGRRKGTVMAEDKIHKHCGAKCKGKYVCSKCEDTPEGKIVLTTISSLRTSDLVFYMQSKAKSRLAYANAKLHSKGQRPVNLPMEKGHAKVNVRCTVYTHDNKYVRAIDDGLVLEKYYDDEGERYITVGIDLANDGRLKMIRKKDIKAYKDRRILYDVKSVHPKSIAYLNKRFENMRAK
jgi:hypothetical protein